MSGKKSIRSKLSFIILLMTIIALLASSTCSAISMLNMNKDSLKIAQNDAKDKLAEIANNRSEIADSMLLLAQNHTILVAQGAENLLKNSDKYLKSYTEDNLPDLTCSGKYELGKYSIQVRMPENLLKNIQEVDDLDENGNQKLDKDGNAVKKIVAEINREAQLPGKYTVNQELFLGSLLTNEFSQIERFKNESGDYTGFAASYFCFDDSGIDILGDPKTTNKVMYDGRDTAWYKGAAGLLEKTNYTETSVFWTDPVQDGGGRGISMICSAPVVIDGKLVGVAGSGGLLTNFADLVASSSVGSTGFSFMVSRKDSKVIINPNTSDKEAKDSEVMIETILSESNNTGLKTLSKEINKNNRGFIDSITIDGKECFLAFSALNNNDWTMVTVIEVNDDLIMEGVNALSRSMFNAFAVFAIITIVLVICAVIASRILAKSFTTPIIKLKEGVGVIGTGDLSHMIDIHTGDEIEDLGNSFNDMAINLNDYINNLAAVTAEKERIGTELSVATSIQAAMLPNVFPAFPNQNEFDVYATMNPAKEVGGDFYDFFMVDEKHIAIVIADVSGKGVPAALFMVIAKTLIKDHTYTNNDLGGVFSKVNQLLCESNEGALFVTAFEGVLNLETGEFVYVNAGHEMPFICKKNENYKPYKIKPGFVLAGMEEMRYKSGSIVLDPGDKIFQYTDGVTEATDKDNQLYGMERLESVLGQYSVLPPNLLLPKVKEDIDAFVGEAPQFDDITMICLEYKKRKEDK